LLDAIQYVFEGHPGLKGEARRLAKLVTNDEDLIGGDENHRFKLWPTTGDRPAFTHAMHNGLATDEYEDEVIVRAHEYFQMQADEWLNANDSPVPLAIRAEALETTVTSMLQMVVIDLSLDDDPYIIFETLNARGTPLLESDLVKNYAMSRASQMNLANQAGIWGDLDDNWWSEEATQGRLVRPRKDMLLNYWLAMSTGSDVRADRIFRTFSSHADDLSIDEVMGDVKRDLGNYRRFEEGPRTPDEDKFYYRVSQIMGIGVITPALLLLLSLPDKTRMNSLKAMESFLIRRMLCRGDATKDYNRLTLDLIHELRIKGLGNADKVISDFLRRQTAYSREWPNDQSLEHALDTRAVYNALSRSRLRMILECIEENLRESSLAEHPDVPKGLTIEHVMPQSWKEDKWPLANVLDEQEAIDNRNRLIHTIGNLTLTNGSLNSALSNAPWEDKRKTLRKHSVLLLNDRLLSESEGKDWNEKFIQTRSEHMAKLVAEVWPGPDSAVWG
jgi:hypothetical protein